MTRSTDGENLARCYGILGVAPGASLAEVKSAYRQLARRYHPDTCPVELRSQAQERFVQLNYAYQQLLQYPVPERTIGSTPITTSSPTIRRNQDYQIKIQSYQKLQALLQAKRFARAIALIDGLALRLPRDSEVRQWQAIAYFQWGKDLVQQQQWGKAKVYLRKAIRTDPHNQELFGAVEQELRQLQRRATP